MPTQTLQSSIPGLDNLTGKATNNIQDLLSGLPSSSWARTNNAYWGVGAGQPDTGGVGTFTGNRGADLYNTQANANNQLGFEDLMKLIGTYSGNVGTSAGQQQQGDQFNQSIALQRANDLWRQNFETQQAKDASDFRESGMQFQNEPWWIRQQNEMKTVPSGYFPGDPRGSAAIPYGSMDVSDLPNIAPILVSKPARTPY